jgi:hypothetical protein
MLLNRIIKRFTLYYHKLIKINLMQDIFIFANALEGTLVLRKPLDYENISNFSVQIRAQVSIIFY